MPGALGKVGLAALIGAGAGGTYGAFSDNTSVLGGMLGGAALGAGGYGAARFAGIASRGGLGRAAKVMGRYSRMVSNRGFNSIPSTVGKGSTTAAATANAGAAVTNATSGTAARASRLERMNARAGRSATEAYMPRSVFGNFTGPVGRHVRGSAAAAPKAKWGASDYAAALSAQSASGSRGRFSAGDYNAAFSGQMRRRR